MDDKIVLIAQIDGDSPSYANRMAKFIQKPRARRRACYLIFVLVFAVHDAARAGQRGPLLSFLQTTESGYQWMFWRPGNAQAKLFAATQVEPRHIFWDSSEDCVYYTLDSGIFRSRVDRVPAQPEHIARLPEGFGEVRVLWRETKIGRLRIAAMLAIKQGNMLTKGRVRYRLPNGKTIAGMIIPSWGIPFVCTVLELSDDGKTWKVLSRRATKDLAGDTPGVSVADDLRHERGASNDRLLESYTCSSAPCRNDVPAALLQRACAESGSDLDSDETSIWHPGKDLPSIMFRTVMGDQLHMAPPVLLLAPDDGSIQPLEMQGRKQLGLGIEHSLLLLADETTGARPMVADLKRGTVQFQAEGWGATWVPHNPKTSQ